MRAQLLLRDLSLLLLNSSSVFCGCSLTHAATASCSVTTPISTSCNLKGWGSYTSCISAKHGMNFAFIKSSAIQQFEHREVLKICDRIIQDCFLHLFLSLTCQGTGLGDHLRRLLGERGRSVSPESWLLQTLCCYQRQHCQEEKVVDGYQKNGK